MGLCMENIITHPVCVMLVAPTANSTCGKIFKEMDNEKMVYYVLEKDYAPMLPISKRIYSSLALAQPEILSVLVQGNVQSGISMVQGMCVTGAGYVSVCISNKLFFYSCSLSSFIVSDSEVMSGDEENVCSSPPRLPLSPVYQTPCAPATGIMFWGSPSSTSSSYKSHRNTVKSVHFTSSPVLHPGSVTAGRSPLTPVNRPLTQLMSFTERRPQMPPRNCPMPSKCPVTTPSAGKNFSRCKSTMVAELFKFFNKSVFEEKVSYGNK